MGFLVLVVRGETGKIFVAQEHKNFVVVIHVVLNVVEEDLLVGNKLPSV